MDKHHIIRILVAGLKPKRRLLEITRLAAMPLAEVQKLFAERIVCLRLLRLQDEERMDIQPVVFEMDAYATRR